jgi:hypothetical protein
MASTFAGSESSDFYLWGHLNTLVYAAPVDNEETLHRCIVGACQTTETFTESHGGHFENLS